MSVQNTDFLFFLVFWKYLSNYEVYCKYWEKHKILYENDYVHLFTNSNASEDIKMLQFVIQPYSSITSVWYCQLNDILLKVEIQPFIIFRTNGIIKKAYRIIFIDNWMLFNFVYIKYWRKTSCFQKSLNKISLVSY